MSGLDSAKLKRATRAKPPSWRSHAVAPLSADSHPLPLAPARHVSAAHRRANAQDAATCPRSCSAQRRVEDLLEVLQHVDWRPVRAELLRDFDPICELLSGRNRVQLALLCLRPWISA
eukprot:3668644-Rhodomonas_salina.4